MIWYNSNGIVNIFSLSQVVDKHRLTFEISQDGEIMVHKKDEKQSDKDSQ